jgi:hypothetical protein
MILPVLARSSRAWLRTLAAFIVVAALSSRSAAAGMRGATISPSGSGDFVFFVNQMTDVVALEANITYDVSTLEEGELSVTNLLARARVATDNSMPGTLRLKATSASALNGSGNIAILHFNQPDATPGRILSATLYLSERSGHQSSIPVTIINPVKHEDPLPADSAGTGQERPPDKGPAAVSPPVSPESAPGPEPPSPVAVASDPVEARTARVLGKVPAGKGLIVQSQMSALDSIRKLFRAPGPEEIAELFRSRGPGPFVQDPPVALSDGKSSIMLRAETACGPDRAPSFVLREAHCLELRPVGDTGWALTVLPDQGAYAVTVSLLCADSVIEYPLLVAPLLSEYLATRPDATDTPLDTYVRAANQLAAGSLGPAPSPVTGVGKP